MEKKKAIVVTIGFIGEVIENMTDELTGDLLPADKKFFKTHLEALRITRQILAEKLMDELIESGNGMSYDAINGKVIFGTIEEAFEDDEDEDVLQH